MNKQIKSQFHDNNEIQKYSQEAFDEVPNRNFKIVSDD